MILPEAKNIKIGDAEFPNVKWRSRVVFEYENMTGASYYKFDGKLENQFKLFYCAAKIGSILTTGKFDYTFEQFLEATDDYFTETVNAFSEALYPGTSDNKKKIKQK